MARSSKPPAPKPAHFTQESISSGLPKLDRRIEDLKLFDVQTLMKRWDPAAEALANRVNSTLRDLLGHDTIEYEEYSVGSFDTLPITLGGWPEPIETVRNGYKEGINRTIVNLQTLRSLLEEKLGDFESESSRPTSALPTTAPGRRVFVVHGHDTAAKLKVTRFLELLELQPIILHEQANEGKTIIEKFESNANVAFATVLLTADDIGHPVNQPGMSKPRARQNVILELGFFLGRLGRQKVAVLYQEGVELPSDYQGVLFIPLDSGDSWHIPLARELKKAGLQIDLNRVL